MTFHNILICKLRYIGDVLLCVPALRALRTQYKTARIVMAVNAGTDEVLRNNPYIDDILVVPHSWGLVQWQFLREIRRQRFDCVIDFTDGDRSAVLTALTGAPKRIGYNREHRWRGWMYSECVFPSSESVHMVDYHAQALASLGGETQVGDPEVFIGSDDAQTASRLVKGLNLHDRRWVMLHPTARYWFKAWPFERFATLSDWFQEKGVSVVLVGSSKDREIGDHIQQATRHPPISLIGQTNLLELAALMKRAALFIGNDAGPMHVAAAVGCPVVALFGPSDPKVWGPRGSKATVLYKGLDCRECFYPGCFRGESSCMKLITVDDVINASIPFLPVNCL